MIVTNGITAWLAAAGGKNRVKDQPLLPVFMGLKTLTDVVVTAELCREEWQENKALCAYCQMATLTPVASLLLAMPEALRGLRQMRMATRPSTWARSSI